MASDDEVITAWKNRVAAASSLIASEYTLSQLIIEKDAAAQICSGVFAERATHPQFVDHVAALIAIIKAIYDKVRANPPFKKLGGRSIPKQFTCFSCNGTSITTPLVKTDCKHIFHMSCMAETVGAGITRCPICSRKLPDGWTGMNLTVLTGPHDMVRMVYDLVSDIFPEVRAEN